MFNSCADVGALAPGPEPGPNPGPGPVLPPGSPGCSVRPAPLDVYLLVDCDWERARAAAALTFLPYVAPGRKFVLWSGSAGFEPVVNPPDGVGLTTRDAVLRLIDSFRPRACVQSNFLPGQVGIAMRRLVQEQQGRSTPFVVAVFTSRADNLFNEVELRNTLTQIQNLQQGRRGQIYFAHSGTSVPPVLQRLQSQNLLVVNSVFSSSQFADIISNTMCVQIQSALQG